MTISVLETAMKHRGIRSLAMLVLGSLLTAGYAQSSASANDDGSIDIIVPPIYVAQTLVALVNGKSPVKQEYQRGLIACQNVGAATTPLNDEDVEKLGHTYYQLWFDGARSAWQEDQWNYDMTGDGVMSCHFEVVHTSEKVITTLKVSYEIDLISHTVVSEPPLWDNRARGRSNNDDELGLGAAQAGLQRIGYAADAGQRCLRWRGPLGDESCTWSEGSPWGFPRGDGGNQAVSYDPGVIVLWVHQPNRTGPELTTQKMTVGGQPFDDALFLPPSGATVKVGEP